VEVAFSHWSASWPVLIGYLVVAVAQLAGLRRLLAGGQPAAQGSAERARLGRESVLFQLGLLIVVLALVSPVGYWSDVYLWVRALQDLLVALIGPGLIVLGAPWASFRQLRGQPGRLAEASHSAATTGRPLRAPRLLSVPVLMVIVFNVVWLAWQLPVLFDLAQSNSVVALAEHVSYLGTGIWFWLALISSRPFSQPSAPLRRMALLVGTVAAWTVFGMVLVFGSGVLYPTYANAAHHIMTVLDDQQLAGAVLWMGSLPALIGAGVALMMEWLSNEESAELSAGLDRMLAPRRHGWPTRPVSR
jgi:putative membrane protein